ncbi:hypothetical protein VXE65_20880 [Mycolicibacterium conceptionense]|uniref:hypothetical protein n=1 Tax=Mycolicibacterium conceptionense TaxID=451644 RepID=UPI003204F930
MTTTTAPSAQAAGAEPGPTRPTKHTAPALLETTPDANTAIWTSHGHGDYNGHDITASIASDDTRRLWVSIAEADPLTPSDVRQLIAHLQYALTTLEGAPLNVDTYRAHATSPQRDGIIEAVVDETTDIDTITSFCSDHRDRGRTVSVETRHWQTLTEASGWHRNHDL